MVADGASAAILYPSRREAADSLARALRAQGGTVVLVHAEASDPVALNAALDTAFAALGRLDILVRVGGSCSPANPTNGRRR